MDSILDHNHLHGTPFSSKNLQEAVRRVIEEEEKYAKSNVNNVTTDTLFSSSVTINAQNKDANVTNERRISSDIHAETIKEFKVCTIQSTISNSAYSDSKEQVDAINNSKELVENLSNSEEIVDAVSDPKSD